MKGKIFILIISTLLLTINTLCQSTAIGRISAEIIEPIIITKNTDMDFGAIESNINGGDIELTPQGIRNTTESIKLSDKRTVSNASFKIMGQPKYNYSITLPNNANLNNNSNQLIVDSFTSYPSGTGTIDDNGNGTINIGATLHMNPNQSVGIYSNDNGLIVVVNYN